MLGLRNDPIVARPIAFPLGLRPVGVVRKPFELSVDTAVAVLTPLLLCGLELFDGGGPIRRSGVTISTAPVSVDAGLQPVGLGRGRLRVGVGDGVASLGLPITLLCGCVSAVGARDQTACLGRVGFVSLFAFGRGRVSLIGVAIALIADPVPLVGDLVTFVRGSLPRVSATFRRLS